LKIKKEKKGNQFMAAKGGEKRTGHNLYNNLYADKSIIYE